MQSQVFNFFFLSVLLSFSGMVFGQSYNYLSPFNSQGVPTNILMDSVSPQLVSNISASLPENYKVPIYHPEYLATGITTDIHLDDSASVWVTFVNEGAGYKNVLGFYTYTGAIPATPPTASQITIIFPNVSKQGSGGGLLTGNQMFLGSFPAGTNIGWVLIANGFNSNTSTVTNGNWILYSTPQYNPEADSNLRVHNVLLYDSTTNKVVLGFEDIRRDYSNCDQDFNDALFYITATPDTAINIANVNKTTQGTGNVGGGNTGGLESDNRLASVIATRRFERLKSEKIDFDHPTAERRFTKETAQNRTSSAALSQFFPEMPFDSATVAYVSTPEDLVNITNAKEVMSVDYFETNSRSSVMLATLTENTVYNHTKVICDRLSGASLANIKTLEVNGYKFILSQLQQANGDWEYATCFVAYEDNNGDLKLQTEWTIDQYPTSDKFYNFQIWSKAPHLTQKMIEEVMIKLNAYKPLTLVPSQLQLPKVFVKKGYYADGILEVEVENTINAKEVTIKGALSRTETAPMHEDWSYTFPLTGATVQKFALPIGKIFDSGMSVENDVDGAIDVLYLADGPWGVSKASAQDQVSVFQVNSNSSSYTNDKAMAIERNVSLKGQASEYVSLFRMFRSNAAPIDASKYNYLTFKGKIQGEVTLTLVKSSIEKWEEQFKMNLQLGNNLDEFALPLDMLTSTGNHKKDWSDVTSLVFSIKGNSQAATTFEVNLEDVAFETREKSQIEKDASKQVITYPSPCNEVVNIDFLSNATEEGSIQIFDAAGRLVISESTSLKQGMNHHIIDVKSLSSGVYMLSLRAKSQNMQTKIIVE